MLAAEVVAILAAVIWLYLALGHGRFWRTSIRLPHSTDPSAWPRVVAVVPARNEADVLPATLPTLLAQRYPGTFRVVLVDDDSDDGTGALARSLGADVVPGSGPPPGWSGKVAAMALGLEAAADADYVLFTDADIAYPPDALTALVRAATADDRVLVSQMVRLRARSPWERVIVPAFVYFFAQLYPFARVNGPGPTAAAAGGCMMVRRDVLVAAGGFEPIRDAVIDDVALGTLLKRHGRIWLGLSDDIESARDYPHLADLWQMVARSAYTQLRYSPLLLAGTVLGLAFTYLVPPVAAIAGLATAHWVLAVAGLTGWLMMAGTYAAMLRFYRQPVWQALLLPAVATLYAGMTVDSARRHYAGRGAAWKGRVGAGVSGDAP